MLRGFDGADNFDDAGTTSILGRAVSLRFPDIREKRGRECVDALVDFITETAIVRAEVEELRMRGHVQLLDARKRLARVGGPVARTKQATDEMRRGMWPDIAEEIDHWRWVIDRCVEQINRLGSDYDAASRAYTLVSGS